MENTNSNHVFIYIFLPHVYVAETAKRCWFPDFCLCLWTLFPTSSEELLWKSVGLKLLPSHHPCITNHASYQLS